MNGSPAVKVSILMPSFNVGKYIEPCIRSVISQTLQEIEIICIDAGSTDGTLEILQKYSTMDSRIRLIHSDRKSYGYQVNLGIETASGEYIGIVETDDYAADNMFQILYEHAVQFGKPDVVKSAYYRLLKKGSDEQLVPHYIISSETKKPFPISQHYELLSEHPSIWSCIYKRSFLLQKNIRMPELPGAAWVDNPFLFQSLCEARQIVWVHQPLYVYRELNPDSSTNLMKDCSIPISRANEIKDYLESKYPRNIHLEAVLYDRVLYYKKLISSSPFCDDTHLTAMSQLMHRFRKRAVFFRHLKWGLKIAGDVIEDCREHGFKATVETVQQKAKSKFRPSHSGEHSR